VSDDLVGEVFWKVVQRADEALDLLDESSPLDQELCDLPLPLGRESVERGRVAREQRRLEVGLRRFWIRAVYASAPV
jgi:hypothetical protein